MHCIRFVSIVRRVYLAKWIQVKPAYVNSKTDGPIVTLVNQSIRFNQEAARKVGGDRFTRVGIYIDDEDRRIGFKFFDRDEQNTYKLMKGKGGSFSVRIKKLTKQYFWIGIAMEGSLEERRFELNTDDSIYFIKLMPSFEESAYSVESIPNNTRGVYRLRDHSETIVYIGQGHIAERVREHISKDWGKSISKIEYFETDNEKDRIQWEKYFLDRFKEKQGEFPRHNAIGGIHRH